MKKTLSPDEVQNQKRCMKILIAEDDEISAFFLSTILEGYSKEILSAVTGVEAVDACRNNPDIDLIMMDVRMPEMNGYEATKQIRYFNKEVIIIAQTAFGIGGEMEKARATSVGCNDYISKPIDVKFLEGLMRKYFKTQEKRDEPFVS